MTLAITPEELDKLNDYERGWLDGLCTYAWYKGSVAYVGVAGATYAQAVDRFLRQRGRR